jgi:hypothetical protein
VGKREMRKEGEREEGKEINMSILGGVFHDIRA